MEGAEKKTMEILNKRCGRYKKMRTKAVKGGRKLGSEKTGRKKANEMRGSREKHISSQDGVFT
jgi:hypothetical protein